MIVGPKRLRWPDMNASTLKLRSLLAHAVLGLLLLFGQQQAIRHWSSHAVKATPAKTQAAPAEIHCDACDRLAAFGAALPALALALPMLPLRDQAGLPTGDISAPATAAATGYLSRAPPVLG